MKALLSLLVLLVSTSLHAQRAQLPGSSRGQEAIEKHNKNLDKIAAKYGKSRPQLERDLKMDESLVLDAKGDLYVSEEALIPEYLGDDEAVLNPQASNIPDSEALKLHSRPGSSRKIILDFNGEQVTNSYWASGTINAEAFDMDGSPGFSATELARIKDIWLRVAEDYAQFDVDVTTEDSSSYNGMKVIITPSNEWYGSAGGVAYLSTFGTSQPCWVFSDLLNNSAKNIAEAASHEAGHTLSLYHQSKYDANGTRLATYHTGIGSGDTGWAPIMGVGYYQKNSLWHNGTTSSATTFQDDVAIISRKLAVIPDEAGSTLSSNSPMVKSLVAGGLQNFKHQGLISYQGDIDVIKLDIGQGDLSLKVAGAVAAPNTDLRVVLRSPSNQILADVNPAGSVDAIINLPALPEGVYSLQVIPTGYTDANGNVMYSDYGIQGRYYISGSAVPGAGGDTGGGNPNTAPVVNAGADQTLSYTVSSANLSGQASDDGVIASIKWSQVSGPSAAVIASSTSLQTSVSGLISGVYTFRLSVVDDYGALSSDDVKVSVGSAPQPQAPIVSAGSDLTVLLPTNSVSIQGSASDADGSIASVSWSQVSGPSAAVLSQNGTSLVASELVAGTYSFRLTAVDNSGLSSSDTMNVVVKTAKGKGGGKGGPKK